MGKIDRAHNHRSPGAGLFGCKMSSHDRNGKQLTRRKSLSTLTHDASSRSASIAMPNNRSEDVDIYALNAWSSSISMIEFHCGHVMIASAYLPGRSSSIRSLFFCLSISA